MDDEQHVDAELDAYALGALEADEVAAVEAHLSGCARCRDFAVRSRASAGMLLFSAPLVEPAPDLRARILRRVHEVAIADAAAETAPAPAPPAERAGADWGLLGRLFGGRRDAGQPGDSGRTSALLEDLLATPGSVVWNVTGTVDAPGAAARLIGVPGGRDAVLVTSGLPHLPPGRVYQVWLLRGGQPVPNALFRVARGGRGRQIVRAPTTLGDFQVVAVTPEPESGSPAPTGPILLMGELTA
ncbi:MAG TPA: anti-sigma factor [Ktedonobacterales bacterium]|jgi:anti-sigma-K factor RskA